MLQTQPVLSSPKAHWPAQQLGTPSSQPWKAGSQERQLVTTTLGQGRSLFEELLNTAAMENLGNERNPSLFSLPKPVRAEGQCSHQPGASSCPLPGCPQPCGHLHSALSTTGCRVLGHRWSAGGPHWMPQNTGSCRGPALRSHGDKLLVTCTPKMEQLC